MDPSEKAERQKKTKADSSARLYAALSPAERIERNKASVENKARKHQLLTPEEIEEKNKKTRTKAHEKAQNMTSAEYILEKQRRAEYDKIRNATKTKTKNHTNPYILGNIKMKPFHPPILHTNPEALQCLKQASDDFHLISEAKFPPTLENPYIHYNQTVKALDTLNFENKQTCFSCSLTTPLIAYESMTSDL